MAWYPEAIRKNIPPGSNDPKIRPRGIINHIRAGLGDSLFDVFQSRGGIEAHFYVRFSGVTEQYRDTEYEADAQTDGNSFYLDGVRWGHISVEHEGKDGDPLTPEQIEADKKLFLWLHQTHNIPLQRLETWNGRGIGWHCQFVQFNPLRKACPTQRRIDQIKNTIEPWYASAIVPVLTERAIPLPRKDSEMRLVQISTDKVPQRIFFLAGDNATYVPTPSEAKELVEITQQGIIHGIKESTLRRYYPAVNPLMTKLGQVYDQQKALGASVTQILAAQESLVLQLENGKDATA